MTKPNRATPGGRNRRILANGRSSGRPMTRPGWNVRRTARIVPVNTAGPASARGVPGELRVAGGGAGHRIPPAWRMAACRVSVSRQPRRRLRDCPFWAGRATWWQQVIPGRVASARSGGGWQPRASDAIGGMRYRQQWAPSRHRARTRRSETRRPDGACSCSVIGAPPDRSAHSRRYGAGRQRLR